MGTPQEIEAKAQEVEVAARDLEGFDGLITAISAIDNWTAIALVNKDQIDTMISELEAAKEAINGDPLRQGAVIFNQGNPLIQTSQENIDSVGDHLKAVFLPAGKAQKEAELRQLTKEYNDLVNQITYTVDDASGFVVDEVVEGTVNSVLQRAIIVSINSNDIDVLMLTPGTFSAGVLLTGQIGSHTATIQ